MAWPRPSRTTLELSQQSGSYSETLTARGGLAVCINQLPRRLSRTSGRVVWRRAEHPGFPPILHRLGDDHLILDRLYLRRLS
jgi:hypothetical protein